MKRDMSRVIVSSALLLIFTRAPLSAETLTLEQYLEKHNPKELAKYKKLNPPPTAKAAPASVQQPAAAAPKPPAGPKYTFLSKTPNDLSPCGGVIFVLRRDMNDLGSSPDGCPTPFNSDGVKGALFSYGNDLSKHNGTWTAQGLAALLYNTEPRLDLNSPSYSLLGFNFGPFVGSNTVLNSAKSQSKSNTEVWNYGLIGSAEFAPPQGIGLYHNFNFSAGVVSNDLTNVSAFNQTIQYSPAWAAFYIARPFEVGTLPLYLQFDPSLISQFDQAIDHNKANRLSFNDQYTSYRLGPQMVVKLTPNKSETDTQFLALTRFSAFLTYHWAYETVGDRALPLFSAEVDYTLDEAKHFALTATYQKGYDENTGIWKNQMLIGLTGKM
jgi:hypothetical protein